MAERYKCTLPSATLKKAIVELNEPEDNSERLNAIDDFRKLFDVKFPDTKLPRQDDAFLLRFLRAKKFDQNRAIATLYNYATHPSEWTEVFEKIQNPVLIRDTLESGVVIPLAGKAKDGSTVLIGRPGLGENTALLDLMASLFLTVDTLLEDEEVQVHGITVVDDLAYMGMDMVKQLNPFVGRKFMNLIQNCLPIRLKSINVTNEPKVFDIMYAIIYPLMNEKIKKRFRIHGTDFTSLFEIVNRDVLPPMFAGNGPDLDPEALTERLLGAQTQL